MNAIKDLFFSIGHRIWLGSHRSIKGKVLYVQESGESKVMATADMPDKNQDSVRVVCISDTHGRHGDVDVPAGDILCFAGDMLLINRHFSHARGVRQLRGFSKWLTQLPHRHKIVIAGNHDAVVERLQATELDEIFEGCHYLQDSGVTNCLGLQIWGSPSSRGSSPNNAFQSDRARRLSAVPEGVDLLLTHGPLSRNDLERMRPRIHLSGHIHERYGAKLRGGTLCLNASIMDGRYRPWHAPIVIDVRVQR